MRIAFATTIIELIAENRQNSPHLTERRWCSDACRMKSYTAYARRTPFPMAELDALVDETAETLLNAIKAAATKATVPRHLLSLAQAYALVVASGAALAPA